VPTIVVKRAARLRSFTPTGLLLVAYNTVEKDSARPRTFAQGGSNLEDDLSGQVVLQIRSEPARPLSRPGGRFRLFAPPPRKPNRN